MVITMQTSNSKRLGSGYSSIYKTPGWKEEQYNFEIRLGNYARYRSKNAHEAVNKGLSRMRHILWAYYHNQVVNLGKNEFFLRAFTKDDPSMAGQVGKEVGKQIFEIIGDNFTQKIDKTLSGSSGNLCEKMAAFYNASGISSDASNQSFNFKNIMQEIVTADKNRSNYLIDKLDLNKRSVDGAIKHNSKNIFKAGLSSGLHNLFKGPDVYSKYGMDFKSYDKYDRGLKVKYNTDEKKEPTQNIPEKTNDTASLAIKESISPNGFRLTENGSSSITTKLLNTAKWLGLKGQDLLNFRLAIMGWLLPDGDHSLYEILYSSHAAGIRGKEDLTDAASMDETIDPLTKNEIRDNCGTLPINECLWKRFTVNNYESINGMSLISVPSEVKKDLIAIDIYTDKYHLLLNRKLALTSVLGNKLGSFTAKQYFKKAISDALHLSLISTISTTYFDRLTPECKKLISPLLVKYISNDYIIYINKITKATEYQDALKKFPSSNNIDSKTVFKFCSSAVNDLINNYTLIENLTNDLDVVNNAIIEFLNKENKYSKKVYSGGWISSIASEYRVNNILKIPSFISTSKDISTASTFAQKVHPNKIKKRALFIIKLNGINGIDIMWYSPKKDEQEVLLPVGTQLKVKYVSKTPLDNSDHINVDSITYVYLEEVGGTPQPHRWIPQYRNPSKVYPTKFY